MTTLATELKTEELCIPDRAKFQLPQDLATALMEKFGGKQVQVTRLGGNSSSGILESIASNNGQLALVFKNEIVPWSAVTKIASY